MEQGWVSLGKNFRGCDGNGWGAGGSQGCSRSILPTFEGRGAHLCKLELAKSCSVASDRGSYVRFSPHLEGSFNGNLEAIRDQGRKTRKVAWGPWAKCLQHWMGSGEGRERGKGRQAMGQRMTDKFCATGAGLEQDAVCFSRFHVFTK